MNLTVVDGAYRVTRRQGSTVLDATASMFHLSSVAWQGEVMVAQTPDKEVAQHKSQDC